MFKAACAALAALALASCATATGSAPAQVTVENCGRQVAFEQRPEKLYVIGGEAGTLVHAAGGGDKVHTFAPLKGEPLGAAADVLARAAQVPLSGSKDIAREPIIAAAPDLVVTFGFPDFGPDELAAAGIPTLIVSGYCGGFGAGQSAVRDPLEEMYADITTLGRVLGTEQRAADSVARLRSRVDAARASVEPAPGTTAALFVPGADGALGAYGKRSMVHTQMSVLGLANAFADADERYFEPTTEALVEAAPRHVIALYEAADTTEPDVRAALTDRPELTTIPAIADDDVLVLDFFYSGHGTLAVDGLEKLATQLRG